MTEPQFDQQQLLALAQEENPSLKAFGPVRWRPPGVRSAKSRFLPTVSVSANIQGFTQEFTNESLANQRLAGAQSNAENCRFQNALIATLPGGGVPGFPTAASSPTATPSNLDATGDALLPSFRDQVIGSNDVFPFSFTSSLAARLTISLPIFDGFTRNLQVAQAQAAEDDLTSVVGLQLEAEVAARFSGCGTPIWRSRCRSRAASRPGNSSAWPRTATGWAPDRRWKSRTRRTPSPAPKETT